MSFGPLILAALLSADDGGLRFVMSMSGMPIGTVAVTRTGSAYRYESVTLFEGAQRVRRVELELDEAGRTKSGVMPELAYLAVERALGCVSVVEELHGAPEQVCLDADDAGLVRGRIGKDAFTAKYDAKRLAWLEVLGVRFEASQEAVTLTGAPFERGVPLPRKKRRPAGLKSVVVTPSGEGEVTQRCLVVARAAVAHDSSLSVVLGVIVEDGSVWPHAWVRRGKEHFDPSVPEGESPERTYFPLKDAEAGRFYLQLLSGKLRFE